MTYLPFRRAPSLQRVPLKQLGSGEPDSSTFLRGDGTWAAPSGSGGAPTGSQYVTLATDATLTAERVLTAGSGIALVDNGAGGTLVVSATGGANALDATVNFGATFQAFASVVVTGQAWVTGTSRVIATVKAAAGKATETMLFQFNPVISDLVVGTGFTLTVYTPTKAKGTYTFSCLGV